MFGPCWLNFYGSPREFSELPDEYDDLNLGKVSFRHTLTYLFLMTSIECHIKWPTTHGAPNIPFRTELSVMVFIPENILAILRVSPLPNFPSFPSRLGRRNLTYRIASKLVYLHFYVCLLEYLTISLVYIVFTGRGSGIQGSIVGGVRKQVGWRNRQGIGKDERTWTYSCTGNAITLAWITFRLEYYVILHTGQLTN